MKAFIQFIGFALLVGFAWYVIRDKRSAEFKNNLPPQSFQSRSDTTLSPLYRKTLPRIPLIAPGNFSLNNSYCIEIGKLYTFLFDSLRNEQLPVTQIQGTSLTDMDAATLIQLLAYNATQVNASSRRVTLILIALLLKDPTETEYFVRDYLMQDSQWLFTCQNLHRLLMEEPNNTALQQAYVAVLTPATKAQTLDYLIAVQFLERGPMDEYYDVNKVILERFDKAILLLLLDKVDDYYWLAAYPERDAEQGILEILEAREIKNQPAFK